MVGYDVWQSRFAADPAVVGRRVRLSGAVHTVVGVMPEHFAFPINHRVWTPLRADPSRDAEGETPGVFVFARLAPGATLEGAEAELETIGLLAPAAGGETTAGPLRTQVVAYARGFGVEIDPWMAGFILVLVTLLLAPPCANVAILVYARTITRQQEFAARYALGASRERIVGQLFVEGLVLAVGAAGAALVLVRLFFALAPIDAGQWGGGATPFWMDFGLSAQLVFFVVGLAVVAATIAGLVPALQATGRLMQTGLRALGSRTSMQLGATWTVLVVAQIGFSVAVLPSAAELAWGLVRPAILGPGFAPEEFLTARLDIEPPTQQDTASAERSLASRFADLLDELVRQLETEPGVLGVTVAATSPGEVNRRMALVEIDGVPTRPFSLSSGHDVNFLSVDDGFFDVFDVALLAGRRFDAGDLTTRTAIVNQTLAQDIVPYGSPLGRRVRYFPGQGVDTAARAGTGRRAASEAGPWYEIVGVVDDLPANTNTRTMYHLMAPGQIHPVTLSLRVAPTQVGVANRLRELVTALDPSVRLDRLRPLDEIYRVQWEGNGAGAVGLAVATLSVLLLSAAGLYGLMSFTVNQQRREIGIRSALGAQPRRLLAGIFRRALGQVAVGAVIGVLVGIAFKSYLPIEELGA